MKYIGISDKVLDKWLEGKEYLSSSDEGEAVAIAGGHWLATGERATVFMSADGFMNSLNFLTSWIIPENIGIHFVISYGRTEKPHFVASELLEDLITILKTYDAENVSFELMRKE